MFKCCAVCVWLSVILIQVCGALITNNYNRNDQVNLQATQQRAVEDLIQRLLPDHVDQFVIQVDISLKVDHKDVLILEKKFPDAALQITASSGVAAAAGLHHYLKYFCQAHVSWDFNQLNLTKCQKEDIYEKSEFNDRYRYYQNACTPSYSFVWYDWPKWEQHIDWMAMQGFNLVPAQNGQEEIWRRVYSQLGLTDEEIDAQFAGPAFLAWNRMGNLRGWAGPLSLSWHAKQVELNHRIIRRMRDFGMTTILPAFAGQVPKALIRLYPNATYYDLPRWNGFGDNYCCPYLLDPTEDLFNKIGTLFLNESINEFGTDHIYNCDSFNEMTPFTTNLEQLRRIGEAIYASMTVVDPEAIWLLQGWLFHYESDYWTHERAKSFITSVPTGKMIVLDLQSEQFPQYDRLESYFGQPYIWCMLHNFGGTLGMFGSAEIINNRVFEARNAANSTLIGTGITPEGIDQNYVVYDLMSEMSYRKAPAELSRWFRDYATRRYGMENANISAAWDILRRTVYSFNGTELMRGKFVYNRSPRTKILPWTWYDHKDLQDAFVLFWETELSENRNLRHDFVDITRQMLQNTLDTTYSDMIYAFISKNLQQFQQLKLLFLTAINLVEDVLSLDEKWLLGKWLNAAKKSASSAEEALKFEFNARNQITLWGPQGEIMDYANKQWSGVVKDFFLPRWELFLEHMEDSLKHGTKFNEKGARQDVFEKVEEPFSYSHKEYPEEPTTFSTEIIMQIQARIKTLLETATKLEITQRQLRRETKAKRKSTS